MPKSLPLGEDRPCTVYMSFRSRPPADRFTDLDLVQHLVGEAGIRFVAAAWSFPLSGSSSIIPSFLVQSATFSSFSPRAPPAV